MSLTKIAEDYKKYERSSVMKKIAEAALEGDYIGQTSSATFAEIVEELTKLKIHRGSSIFDAGCGNGVFAFPLAKEFDYRVFGVDLSESVISNANKTAEKLALQQKCHFEQQDFSLYQSENKYDLILSIGSLYWNQPLELTLKNWYHLLNPNGNLLIFTNLQESELSPEEKLYLEETCFFSRDFFEKTLMATGYSELSFQDKTSFYRTWLAKWCASMEVYEEEIKNELGVVQSEKMKQRFLAYQKLALNQKVKRIVITAKRG